MSKRQATTISLPNERASQLRAIATARGVSVTELICNYIESEIRAAVIPHDIPGFRVTVVKGLVKFEIPGRKITLTMREVTEIADILEQPDRWYELTILENGKHAFEIRRRGRGVAIRFCEHEKFREWSRRGLSRSTIPWFRRGLSPSTARDLARQFRAVLKQ